jgi:hypothetical protein
MQTRRNAKVIGVLVLCCGVAYLLGWYTYFGSFTRGCIYTEQKLSIPEEFARGVVTVAKDAYVAVGQDTNELSYTCLPFMGSIQRELVGPDDIDNLTIGRKYFTDRGLAVEPVKKGTTFRVVDVMAVTKHGITTIDSGPGPIYFLILKDQNNLLYHIATVSLGINKQDLFLSFRDPSQPSSDSSVKLLSPDSFEEEDDHRKESAITYTGELMEVSTEYLEQTEPNWKKILNRLEQGEKINLYVELWPEDESHRSITLSENQEERARQVKQLQDSFFAKISKNLALTGVKREEYHPYIQMEGNPTLLNYLVDHRVELRIKNISEIKEVQYSK